MADHLYDHIGAGYDTTRKADPEIVHRLCCHLYAPRGTKVLDVACGTGNYTEQLQRSGFEVTGVDTSVEMLSAARSKSVAVNWVQADAARLPFPDSTCGGATCVLGIHHFDSLATVFGEVSRVLEHGRFVIFTSTPAQMRTYWLNAYFPEAIEAAIRQMPSLEDVVDALTSACFQHIGVESFLVEPALQDMFLYSGKHAPQVYLNETVRRGISTFARLASLREVESGCRKLQGDIASGHIDQVIRAHPSIHGDYIFFVAEK